MKLPLMEISFSIMLLGMLAYLIGAYIKTHKELKELKKNAKKRKDHLRKV